jgi:hypothetical protein
MVLLRLMMLSARHLSQQLVCCSSCCGHPLLHGHLWS